MRFHPAPWNLGHRILLAVAVAVLALAPFAPARMTAFFLTAGLLPGCAVAARSRFGWWASLGLGSALSPVMFGAFALFALESGAGVAAAARIALAACLLVFVLAWRGSHRPDPIDRRLLLGFGVLVALAALMSFALPLSNVWWRTRDDSWFHAAVTNKLLRDGLPLTDPYFAGLRLQYMYFYHALLASCASLTGLDPFHAMILVNAIALFSCAAAFHALAGMFARRTGPRLLATALWLFGMNGWFYLFGVTRIARAMFGESHGSVMWRHFFPWTPNGHATAMSLISVEGNQFMFLDKFMLGTAFSLTFSLAAGVLFMLLSARRGEWSLRHDAALLLFCAGMLWLHAVTGIAVISVTAAVLALLLLVRSQTARGGPSYARLVACIAAGAAVTIPYLRSVMPRAGEHALAGFAFQPWMALGLVAAVAPGLAFAALYFRRARDDRDEPGRFGANPFVELTLGGSGLLALWCVFMLVVGLLVDLSANNETKFAYFVWLPLCALSAGGFELAWDRRRRALLVAVASATLPLHALYFHHAVRDPSELVVTDQERAVYQWIAKSTPRDAVFIEENETVRVPVLANRDLYWGTQTYARQWGYPAAEISARRELRDRVFSATGISEDDVTQLRVLGRRVFVIYRVKADDLINAFERFERTPRLRGRFATAEVAVWEVVLD
jgi:hypothetical protein